MSTVLSLFQIQGRRKSTFHTNHIMEERGERIPRNWPIVPPSIEAGPGLRWQPDWGHWDDFWRKDEVRDIWDTHFGDVKGRAPSWYCESNVIPRGSSIALRATVAQPKEEEETKEKEMDKKDMGENGSGNDNNEDNSSDSDNEEDSIESPWKFATAIIRSKTKVHFGYIEICARVRKSQISSGFWLSSNEEGGWWTGIDVFHYSSGRRNKFANTLFTSTHVHRFGRDEKRKPLSRPQAIKGPADFSDDIHRFAIDWTPQKITWFIDDEEIRTVTNDHHHRPLNLILDSQTFPRWFGIPDTEDSGLPADFEVYYVRTWKRHQDLHEEDGITKVVDKPEDRETVSFKNFDWRK